MGVIVFIVKHPPVLIKIYLMWFRNAQSFTDEVIFQFDFEFDSLTFSWKLKRQATKSKSQEAAIFILCEIFDKHLYNEVL